MRIPRSKYPQIAENRARNTLKKKLAALIEQWMPRLNTNIRRDDQIDDGLFDNLLSELDSVLVTWRGELRSAGFEAYNFTKQQFTKQFKSKYGADPRFNEFWSEQEIDDLVNNVMRRCAGSNQEIVGRMRQIQSRARKRNLPPNETQAQMQALFKTLDARYAFAIRDEMGNFVSSVTERRHKDFGLTQYRWADRRDKSVRGNPSGKYPHAKYSHWHRNGDLFDYDDPPPDGNPGEPSGCRCMAQPEFPDQGQKGLGLMAYFLAGVAAGAANELSEKPA